MSVPEHSLPCGHIICTDCLTGYGHVRGHSIIEITECPLHTQDNDSPPWPQWHVPIIPPGAGIRVLTLDGGGVRGIVELEILRLLQDAVGGIPIQDFFDLIVGTSAGGIIALGLGVKNWSLAECTKTFEDLCAQSFTLRKGMKIKGISSIVQLHFGGMYETRPLEDALQEAFGTGEYFFGGKRSAEGSHHSAKVAVTSTTAAGVRATVLANYNRVSDESTPKLYSFQRSESEMGEFKIWEAARATSAAPTYYKSFIHEGSRHEYLDGGLFHNNPVNIADSERKLLWPKQAHKEPDILLSIGSGYCTTSIPSASVLPEGARNDAVKNLKALKKIAVGHIDSSLNAQNAWLEYTKVHNISNATSFRFRRLNLQLQKEPPKLDDVSKLQMLKENVAQNFRDPHVDISEIAKQLIATSFFFELDRKTQSTHGSKHKFTVIGTIRCRFTPDSDQTQALGEYFQQVTHDQEELLKFIVEEVYNETANQNTVRTRPYPY